MPTKLDLENKSFEAFRPISEFVNQKQKNWTYVARDLILIHQQYVAYEDDFAKCKTYPLLKPVSSRAARLSGLYDQRPACFSYVENLRKRANSTLSVCPYCGLPGRLTLDHYLPRATWAFPHFSVYIRNLVPACDACQSAKGSFVPVAKRTTLRIAELKKLRSSLPTNVRSKKISGLKKKRNLKIASVQPRTLKRILHPYFDEFLVKTIWKLECKDSTNPFTSLELIPTNLCLRRASLVKFHIKKLNIAERIRKDVWHWIRFLVYFFRLNFTFNAAPALRAIEDLLLSTEEKDQTPNSIGCVVLRAIASDMALLNAVLTRATIPPPRLFIKSKGVRL
jgi:5-methylcytosine-specific restriction endonuclease McrA